MSFVLKKKTVPGFGHVSMGRVKFCGLSLCVQRRERVKYAGKERQHWEKQPPHPLPSTQAVSEMALSWGIVYTNVGHA